MEPFFTTKEVGKGSGLGLSMVYGFAKQSNGAFRHRQRVGEGTTAELWLPRAPESAAASRQPPRSRSAGPSCRKLRVLLVDDHAEVRSTTAAVLEDSRPQGRAGRQWRRGARRCSSRGDCDCDLLISDYAMPHLSGTEFLREARAAVPRRRRR